MSAPSRNDRPREPVEDGVTPGRMAPMAPGESGSAAALGGAIQGFATTPPSNGADPESYVKQVTEVARWSEAAGCILVYTDIRLVDPWAGLPRDHREHRAARRSAAPNESRSS